MRKWMIENRWFLYYVLIIIGIINAVRGDLIFTQTFLGGTAGILFVEILISGE